LHEQNAVKSNHPSNQPSIHPSIHGTVRYIFGHVAYIFQRAKTG